MMKLCMPYSSCSRRAGLTLIEVVAAVAILGVVLGGVMVAKARHSRQIAHARATMELVRAADDLLASWFIDPAGVPVGRSGTREGDPTVVWKTRVRDEEPIERIGARVVRVEVALQGQPGAVAVQGAAEPVVIDLVLPPDERSGGRE